MEAGERGVNSSPILREVEAVALNGERSRCSAVDLLLSGDWPGPSLVPAFLLVGVLCPLAAAAFTPVKRPGLPAPA